jgi:predicted O-methyltransferase YrrM
VRARLRRLGLGLATLVGPRPGGFFIPHRYAASATPRDYPALRPLFEAAEPRMRDLLAAIESRTADLLRIRDGDGPARFDQDWFARLDAAAAYALVRRERPARIVEIGSGHSTRFLARAVADEGLGAVLTCIDPHPRASLARLHVRHEARLLDETDRLTLAGLAAGDILFIDSSHVAMPGTDVDRLFLDVLPRLASGVLIHVHDIFLPRDYPPEWAWRGYNEQIVVGALLVGGGYEIMFASRYVLEVPLLSAEHVVHGLLKTDAPDCSLWLRKL